LRASRFLPFLDIPPQEARDESALDADWRGASVVGAGVYAGEQRGGERYVPQLGEEIKLIVKGAGVYDNLMSESYQSIQVIAVVFS